MNLMSWILFSVISLFLQLNSSMSASKYLGHQFRRKKWTETQVLLVLFMNLHKTRTQAEFLTYNEVSG